MDATSLFRRKPASEAAFFSVSFDYLSHGDPLPCDLYINSAAPTVHQHFVRVAHRGTTLAPQDLLRFREKYHQLYIPENQRHLFLGTLCRALHASPVQKTTVLKHAAIHYLDKLFDQSRPFSTEVLVETMEGCRTAVENMVDLLQDYRVNEVQEMIANLSFHDFYTYDHSINTAMYSILIYRSLTPQATRDDLVQAGLCGMFHDIGKIKIPTTLLNNAGDLTPDMLAQLRQHTDIGFEMLTHIRNREETKLLHSEALARVAHEHHENFDGSGYPQKLLGNAIHPMARIVAVADFFDAVTTKRSYQEPLPAAEALALMRNSSGKKLDPEIFEAFLRSAGDIAIQKVYHLKLNSDFDPCQPHHRLPLESIPYLREATSPEKFGKVKIIVNH